MQLSITYIGGPTAILAFNGLRFLTDPTFDPSGAERSSGPVTLHKSSGPALAASQIGKVDAVLLSHEHHFDNLDDAGRALLPSAGKVFTTRDGAQRMGGNATGLDSGETVTLEGVRIRATPAQHGPAGMDRGPVIGFMLTRADDRSPRPRAIYVSGDTVWHPPLAELANAHDVRAAVLFLGAARIPIIDHPLTMTAADAVTAARTFPRAAIIPLHFEGWQHFTESRADVTAAFAQAGLEGRLHWLPAGKAESFEV